MALDVDLGIEKPDLSFAAMDVERRLGFPAGRFTQPGFVLALLLAAMLTVAFFASLLLIPEHHLARSFSSHGWVPYAIVSLSFWALMILLIKAAKIRLQQRALRYRVTPDAVDFTITVDSAQQVLDRLHQVAQEPSAFLLYSRIQFALSNLRNIGRIADVGEILRSRAESDEAAMESSYTVVRGLVWAVPLLGFVGTVIGLSVALGSFGQVLRESGEIDQLRPALQEVTAGLALAFETTLQALLAALLIQLLMTFVRRAEERMLDDFTEYCDRHIITRLRLHESSRPSASSLAGAPA